MIMTSKFNCYGSITFDQRIGFKFSRKNFQQGFSIVESLIGIAVLSIAAAVAASTFFASSTQFRSSSEINELQDLAEADLTAVRDANERLVCVNSSCSLSVENTDKNSYFPIGASNIAFFANLCTNRTMNGGFANQLSALLPSPNSRIVRTMARETQGHRYTVIYTSTAKGQFLRQATLIPTTVAWCPTTLCDSSVSGNCQP